jgi:protease-4
MADLGRLNSAAGAQVYCLECGGVAPVMARPAGAAAQGLVARASWLALLGKLF